MASGKNIDKIIATIDQIPTLPVISQHIQKLLQSDNVSLQQIEDIIELDPPLAAKLLKIVNSSFYGLLNKVSTIDHAVIILGFNEVRNVVLGFAIQSHFNIAIKEFDPGLFWKHSIVCSQIAKYLSKHFSIVDDGTFFLSGLIHDIGKLVIAQYFPEDFNSIIKYITANGSSFSRAEKEVLGVTHYQIGAKLLQQWHFPQKVIMQLFYHHAPWYDKNYTSGSIVIYLSNMLAKMTGHACFEAEKASPDALVIKPSVLNFLNKNGLEIDDDSLKKLRILIKEYLSAETENILSIF